MFIFYRVFRVFVFRFLFDIFIFIFFTATERLWRSLERLAALRPLVHARTVGARRSRRDVCRATHTRWPAAANLTASTALRPMANKHSGCAYGEWKQY